MEEKIRKLQREFAELKKRHNEQTFGLLNELKHMRESKCVALGGHFYYDKQLVEAPTILEPYRTVYIKMCRVCGYRLDCEENES